MKTLIKVLFMFNKVNELEHWDFYHEMLCADDEYETFKSGKEWQKFLGFKP